MPVSITGLAGYQLHILRSLHWASHSSSNNCLLRDYIQDLRNPLQPIVGWSLLLNCSRTTHARKVEGYIETIRLCSPAWSSRLGVGLRAGNPLAHKTLYNTETRSRRNSVDQRITVTSPYDRNKLRTIHVAAN